MTSEHEAPGPGAEAERETDALAPEPLAEQATEEPAPAHEIPGTVAAEPPAITTEHAREALNAAYGDPDAAPEVVRNQPEIALDGTYREYEDSLTAAMANEKVKAAVGSYFLNLKLKRSVMGKELTSLLPGPKKRYILFGPEEGGHSQEDERASRAMVANLALAVDQAANLDAEQPDPEKTYPLVEVAHGSPEADAVHEAVFGIMTQKTWNDRRLIKPIYEDKPPVRGEDGRLRRVTEWQAELYDRPVVVITDYTESPNHQHALNIEPGEVMHYSIRFPPAAGQEASEPPAEPA